MAVRASGQTPGSITVALRTLPPRCPECGAPAKLRTKTPAEPERAAQRYVFVPPTEASDAMVEAVFNRLSGWGLYRDDTTEEAVRDALNTALQVLAKEIEYRWL